MSSIQDEIREIRRELSEIKNQAKQRTVELVDVPEGLNVDQYFDPDRRIMLVERSENGGKHRYITNISGTLMTPLRGVHKILWIHPPDVAQLRADNIPDDLGDNPPIYPSTAEIILIGRYPSVAASGEHDTANTGMESNPDPLGADTSSQISSYGAEAEKNVGITSTKDGIRIQAEGGSITLGKEGISVSGALQTPPAEDHGLTKDKLSVLKLFPESVVTPFPSQLPNLQKMLKIANISAGFIQLIKRIDESWGAVQRTINKEEKP